MSNKKKHSVNVLKARKTDYGIPTFGYKSAFLILITAVVSSTVIPYALSFIGVSFKLGIILSNITITSYMVAYSRFFIESKKQYCKGFWLTYLIFSISFGFIGFFWMYMGTYI